MNTLIKELNGIDKCLECVRPSLKHPDPRVRRATRYGIANLEREKEALMKKAQDQRIRKLIKNKITGVATPY
jgi:hypothetical protein